MNVEVIIPWDAVWLIIGAFGAMALPIVLLQFHIAYRLGQLVTKATLINRRQRQQHKRIQRVESVIGPQLAACTAGK